MSDASDRVRTQASQLVKSNKSQPELVRAAEAIEHDMQRLEELSLSIRRMRLHNDKSIARAARELKDALEQQEMLARGLRAFGEAMLQMQERQQAAIEPLKARAIEIQQRTLRMGEHMQRFAALGASATEIARALQDLSPETDSSSGKPPRADGAAVTKMIEAEQALLALVGEARALASEAEAEDFTDIAREADAMKQRVQATGGRLEALIRDRAAGTS
jgi:DNA repair exonuclease SbcCD ATPase subunit